MIKWITCCFCLLITAFYVNGQEELIDTIELTGLPLRNNNTGGKTKKLRSQVSVSETLSKQTSVFIKNYGPGSLATSSIRGGSAGHTLVLWNGLPITNPFLGLLDLSLLDTWGMSQVNLQKGGNSAMWGSGAIGGVINLDQLNKQNERFTFRNRLSYGSFQTLSEKAKLGIKYEKWTSKTSISILRAENDFPYSLSNGDRRIQSNALQRQTSFNQDLYFTPSGNQELAFHYWHSRANREIPPTTVQSSSDATQFDAADRLSLSWKVLNEKNALRLRAGYYIEDLNYFDFDQEISSITDFETFLSDIDYEYKFNTNNAFNIGVSHFRTIVSSPANYDSDAIENKSALFARYRYRWIQLSGRQEYVNQQLIPFVPALAIDYPILNKILLSAKVSKNYRLPTLNDRFWVPGGNPDLLAESGWSEEVTIKADQKVKNLEINGSITGFNRTVKNWIQWTLEGPFNLNEVWSRGAEVRVNFIYKSSKWSSNLETGYDFIRSTNQQALSFPRVNAGDQLLYTPVHQGFMSWNIIHGRFQLNYRQKYTGATTGINENLDAFTTADLSVRADFFSFNLEAKIRNIWNEQYRIIERRPMPGRNFELIIEYRFNKD